MKKFNFLSLVFVCLLLMFSFSAVHAQEENSAEPDIPNNSPDRQSRPNLLTELGLSPSQRQQIRRINTEKRQLARAAQKRLRDANLNLDQAIYADNLNDGEIQTRMKEVQAAQAELLKIRTTNELAVRRILTIEQLAKFRNLRDQFEQRMANDFGSSRQRPNKNDNQRFKIRSRQLRPRN